MPRVNVQDGHVAAVRVKLGRKTDIGAVRAAFAAFTGVPQQLKLHTAPERPLVVRDEPDRPQPRLDRDAGGGMSVTVGDSSRSRARLSLRRAEPQHDPGAAGAAVLNAELLVAKGYLGT